MSTRASVRQWAHCTVYLMPIVMALEFCIYVGKPNLLRLNLLAVHQLVDVDLDLQVERIIRVEIGFSETVSN